MTLKMKMTQGLIGIILLQAGLTLGANSLDERVAETLAVLSNSNGLTLAQKDQKAVALIRAVNAGGGDVADVMVQLLDITPAAEREHMIAAEVTAEIEADPSGAPAVLAAIIKREPVAMAKQIVAAASLLAPSHRAFSTDKLAAALNAAGLSAEKKGAVMLAAKNPSSVMSAMVVHSVGAQMNAWVPAGMSVHSADVVNEIANGYGLQTR